MIDQATVAAPAARTSARLGSFVIGERLPGAGGALVVSVKGAPESRLAGIAGTARCLSLPDGNPQMAEQAATLLGRLPHLVDDRAVPILEAGVAGKIAYVVEAVPPGEPLRNRLARDKKLAPWQAAVVVHDVARALAAAHAQRVSHGAISAGSVLVDGQGRARLGGFGLTGRGPAKDQAQLAALAFEILAGFPWEAEFGAGATGAALVDRVRGRTNGLTEPVGRVIARGLEGDAVRQFPDIATFGAAFGDAIRGSSAELAAGAWEAISRNDLTMAAILVEMTATYNPAEPELAMLRLRLNGGAMQDPAYAAAALAGPASAIPMTAPGIAAVLAGQQPALTQLDPAAAIGAPGMAAAATTAAALVPPKPQRNPWVIFAIGACGLVILLTVLIAVTFSTV